MRLLRNRKGFTLIELMVVVIIVLVLSGIAVPVYMHYIQEGRKSEAYAVIDATVAGALTYFQRNNTFVGGTFTNFMSADDVGNATQFTYVLSLQSATGFIVTASVNGTWGPAAGRIIWTHANASAPAGNGGRGAFTETGW